MRLCRYYSRLARGWGGGERRRHFEQRRSGLQYCTLYFLIIIFVQGGSPAPYFFSSRPLFVCKLFRQGSTEVLLRPWRAIMDISYLLMHIAASCVLYRLTQLLSPCKTQNPFTPTPFRVRVTIIYSFFLAFVSLNIAFCL